MHENEISTLPSSKLIQRPEVLAYLKELAADIAAHGGLEDKDMLQAVREAHERRQAFALEMFEGRTHRARMAREALCLNVYMEVGAQEHTRRFVQRCEAINQGSFVHFCR